MVPSVQGRQMGLFRRQEQSKATGGLLCPVPPTHLPQGPKAHSPQSLVILELGLQLDEGHIVVIELRDPFCLLPIYVVVGVK